MSVRDDAFVNEEDFREFRNYCRFKQLLDKERGLSSGGGVSVGHSEGNVSVTRFSSNRSSSGRSDGKAVSGRSRSCRREEELSPRTRHRDVSRPSRRRRSRSGRRLRSRSRTPRRESVRRRSVERRGRGGSSTRHTKGDLLEGMPLPLVRGIASMCGGVSQGVPEIEVASYPRGDSVLSHPCGDSAWHHPRGDLILHHPCGDSVDVPDASQGKRMQTTRSDGVQRPGQAPVMPAASNVQRRGQATVVPGKPTPGSVREERPTVAEVVKRAAQQQVKSGDGNRYAMKKKRYLALVLSETVRHILRILNGTF